MNTANTTEHRALRAAMAETLAPLGSPLARRRCAMVRRLQPLDVKRLHAEADVPVTSFEPPRKPFDMYEPLFDMLTHAGLSVLLPLEYRGSLAEAAQQKTRERRGRYCVRQVTVAECRIWRLE
jgi:hypothetical protein